MGKNSTDEKIKELFAYLHSSTVCVLVSCIYFKGEWLDKFPLFTYKKQFHCVGDETAFVEMMSEKKNYPYTHDVNNKFKCVKINYKQRDYSMLIILPDLNDGLDDVVKYVCENGIEVPHNEVYLKLQIPKFQIKFGINLASHLKTLGIEDAFKQSANFKKMTVSDKMHVSEVGHKSFIEVTEGEVVAATGTDTMQHSSLRKQSKPRQFIVNRPFVFVIKYNNLTLFMGKVNALPDCES